MRPTSLAGLLQGIPHTLHGVCADAMVSGISTDSRTLASGDLFFALSGEAVDGHRYVRRALEAGAAAAVVSEIDPEFANGPLIRVDQPLSALGLMARNYRRGFQIPVIGVTGSVGKTSVRELSAAVLRTRFVTLASEKNYNTEVGVPYTLFNIDAEYGAAVLEMGMRGPGEIGWLAEIAEPTIGLITMIGHSHIERLGSREAIAEAKSELLTRLPAGGAAILPRHDDFFETLRARVPAGCRVLIFSDTLDSGADIAVCIEADGLQAVIPGSDPVPVPGPPMLHAARNAAAALAVGLAVGLPLTVAASGLAGAAPVDGRLRTLVAANGIRVIDDCYNAAPESMAAALDLLARSDWPEGAGARENGKGGAEQGRRVAILGDMRELGGVGPELHRAVGRRVVGAGVDLLVSVGELAEEIAQGASDHAREIGARGPEHLHFPDSEAAAAAADRFVAARDIVLVKGSRAMAMESIVEALAGEHGARAHG